MSIHAIYPDDLLHSFSVLFLFWQEKKIPLCKAQTENFRTLFSGSPDAGSKTQAAHVAVLPQQRVTLLWLLPDSVDT